MQNRRVLCLLKNVNSSRLKLGVDPQLLPSETGGSLRFAGQPRRLSLRGLF
jgi:hypothetical protein